ncbi:MAG: BON domain-containing protein, partial [Gemmatimonadaceae bacterium]
LMTHPDIDASDIEVVVSHGVATLAGTTEDRHEKRLAELIAEDVVGVDDVENRLKVRHGFWATVTGERAIELALPRKRADPK